MRRIDLHFEGCFSITTVFSHAQTVVICQSCSSVLCQPTGGRTRLTEGTLFMCADMQISIKLEFSNRLLIPQKGQLIWASSSTTSTNKPFHSKSSCFNDNDPTAFPAPHLPVPHCCSGRELNIQCRPLVPHNHWRPAVDVHRSAQSDRFRHWLH